MSFINSLSRRLRLSAWGLGSSTRPASKRRTRSPRQTFKPCLESLEDRFAPAVVSVLSTADSASASANDVITTSHAGSQADPYQAPTLRAAILYANGHGRTTIDFAIPTSDPNYDASTRSFTMALASALPALTAAGTVLDGYSQPGASANTLATSDNAHLAIVLNGTGLSGFGLDIVGGGCTVQGLVINSWARGVGILVESAGNHIQGNFVGTDESGENAMPNYNPNTAGFGSGIVVYPASSAGNNTIGGTALAARNIVSGNGLVNDNAIATAGVALYGPNNVVQGNFIGTDAAGVNSFSSTQSVGIYVGGSNSRIGGTASGAGNVISGNGTFGGVFAEQTTGLIVQGNLIGTNATGTRAVANHGNGVSIDASRGTTIGGFTFGTQTTDGSGTTVDGGGNLISGNSGWGILDGAGSSGDLVQGNFIGTDLTGKTAIPNGAGGMVFSNLGTNGPTIGFKASDTTTAGYFGSATSYGNLISGNNGDGIDLRVNVSNAVIQGNFIGNSLYGPLLGNTGNGVDLGDGGFNAVANNLIGQPIGPPPTTIGSPLYRGNLIVGNGLNGVDIYNPASGPDNNNNAVIGNDIFANGKLAINLGNGSAPLVNGTTPPSLAANDYQPYPTLSNGILGAFLDDTGVLRTYSTVTVTMAGAPNTSYFEDVFDAFSVPGEASPPQGADGGGTIRQELNITTDSSGSDQETVVFGKISDGTGGFTGSGLPSEGFTATAVKTFLNSQSRLTPEDTSEFSPSIRAYWTSATLKNLIDTATAVGITSFTFPTGFDPDQFAHFQTALDGLGALYGSATVPSFRFNMFWVSGSYSDINVSAMPAGITLDITGVDGQTHAYGHSPALTVGSGTVILSHVILSTATDAPTVLVSGGHLVLRNDVVEESTGYADAAIAVTSGIVDLGTATDPGKNTINVNGAGQLLLNTTSQPIPVVDDTFEVNGVVIPSPFQSTTTLTSSANASLLHQTITLMASVTASAVSGTPTGNVDFVDTSTNTDLGTVALSGGTAGLTISSFAVGNHVIVAKYSGDVTFSTSTGQLTQAVHYNFSGFQGPLKSNGTYQLGRTLPIAFQLTDYYGNFISDLSAVTALQIQQVNAQGQPLGPPTNPKGAGNSQLRYDTSDNQFLFNWDTKGLTAGYFDVVLTLADGTQQKLLLQLR